MADLHYRSLRRRRRVYEFRAGAGFEGYVLGSWQHAFQALIRPFGIPVALTAAITAVGFVCILGALVIRGGDPLYAAASSTVAILGLWLVVGVTSFVQGRRRACIGPPPPAQDPGAAGVREPRRPPPDPGFLAVQLDPPGHTLG